MKEITCPNCNTTFQVDETAFAAILSQVRTKEFEKEIEKRLNEIKEQNQAREENIRIRAEKDFESRLAEKEREILELQKNLTELKGVISGYEDRKKTEFANFSIDKANELNDALSKKDQKISSLEKKLTVQESEHKLKLLETENSIKETLQGKELQIVELNSLLKNQKLESENLIGQIKEQHKIQLQDKQDEIDRLKDFKLKLSTKMVGETLEQHCSTLFAQAQSMGMYPDATFEKDNTAIEHSKGDFIFRDYVEGNEYVSVMFEMKNQMDDTAVKHRNEDFLEKLHKDRQRKNCEYAVLVSMLEQGNDLYDSGIVDKSHRFPKMIVIRPQFFMPVLRLITESARKGFLDKKLLLAELEVARNESRDFSRFEERITRFRETFTTTVQSAHIKFNAATAGIDKVIEGLEKQIKLLKSVKENFENSDKKWERADKLAQESLNIKKLTHGIPSVRKAIEEAKKDSAPALESEN